ncbi:MAG: type IV secretory system conjugative DNA transfer family protein [Candidatus Dojkabacteria bacterium]
MELIFFTCTVLLLLFVVAVVLMRRRFLRVTVNENIPDMVVLQIMVPVENDKTPLAAEQFFQSLHGVLRSQAKANFHFSFEMVATHTGIFFIATCNKRYQRFIENQIYAQYPSAQIRQIQDYAAQQKGRFFVSGSEIGLVREHYLPIKTFASFTVDPLASITGAISKLEKGYEAWVQLVVRPVDNSWQRAGKTKVDATRQREDSEGKRIPLESGESAELSEIERKNTKVGYQFIIRILVKGPDDNIVSHMLEDAEASFKQFQTGQWNSLVKKSPPSGLLTSIRKLLLGMRRGEKMDLLQKYQNRFLDETVTEILNTEELASVFHLPDKSVETPNIIWSKSKKIEPPKNLPVAGVSPFALTDYRNQHIPFGLKDVDRRRHAYILGKTGSGKSNLLKVMIVNDIHEGKGLAVIDPHGDTVDDVMRNIPEERMQDVVYLEPSDMDFPIGLNMLDLKESESMELLSDGIVSVFKKFFGNSWGPRLQYILTNVILTLLHAQNVSLLAVQKMLVDTNYRKFILKQVKDPFLHQFWNQEYAEMSRNPRLLTEAIAPIQNKVGRFLNSPLVRNMVGQVKSNIDLEDVMNSGKILLVNLSQGKIGEENSSLLGGMIVTRLYTNAMQRAKIPEDQRRDFYLYVDEFQNFATDTFVKILSEARKYALNLVVTHQYIDQISPELQTAIFGNVGTLMNFVVGQQDAFKLQKEYSPYLEADDLVNLDRFKLSMKMMIDGAQSRPFTAQTFKAEFQEYGLSEMIKEVSRGKYATEREIVEQKLNKWAKQKYNEKGNLVQVKSGESDRLEGKDRQKRPRKES